MPAANAQLPARTLSELSAELRLALDLADIAVWRHDLATGMMEYDERAWRLLGLAPRPEGLPIAEVRALIHPDDLPSVVESAQQALHSDAPVDVEARYRRSDGSWRYVMTRRCVQRDAQGEPIAFLGVSLDTTERVTEAYRAHEALRRVEHERRERIAAQRESQAKSEFLSRMSHELRTPLNAVLGFAQLLLADEGRIDASTRVERLQHIRAAGEHLLSLINDVLDLSTLQSGELRMALKPVALGPLVRETLPLIEAEARSRGIRIECGDLDVTLRADATRLRQVLLNLLSNAVKYNRDAGRVRIDADSDGVQVTLAVHDTGRGLSAEQQRHLFEPFNRLGAESAGIEGTGVGLAVVKALVEHMGGEVAARSDCGVGSTFSVRLPDARQSTPSSVPGALYELPQESKPYRGRLLYIEDNAVNVLIVEELIARCPGLELASEPDGASGVARTKRMRPDLVLVDLQLPDFDGYEVLRRLRADPDTRGIPCIALSANAMPEEIERALAAGFADYWTKPIDFRAFMASIDNLFAQR